MRWAARTPRLPVEKARTSPGRRRGTITSSSRKNTRYVEEAAREGGVIVGRNGAFILADWPGALHVRLDGPLEQRIARAAHESEIDLERAAQRQKLEDQIRADMSIEFYGWDPREVDRYHLVVNTGLMDLDTCADIIVHVARAKAGRQGASP